MSFEELNRKVRELVQLQKNREQRDKGRLLMASVIIGIVVGVVLLIAVFGLFGVFDVFEPPPGR